MALKNHLKNGLLVILLLCFGAVAVIMLFLPGNVNYPLKFSFTDTSHSALTEGQRLQVKPGFHYSVYATGLDNARVLLISKTGDLLVSQPRSGKITLLGADRNSDGQPDYRRTVIDGLTRPHGMDFYQQWLYIAESNAIGRIRFNHGTGETDGQYQRLVTGLADSGNHWTKTLRLGPDNWFYFTSGSTCNVCEEQDPQRATMLRVKPDGTSLEIFATGLRNTVGFDWDADNRLYGTDNGRDWLGDDFPPCELNLIEKGYFYGWPYANGDNIPDPDFGPGNQARIAESVAPAHAFAAHNAPLGIRFVDLGLEHQSALVALHGSWNRSKKDGYKVVSLIWQDNSIIEQDFFWGFEKNDDVIGRPVDIAQATNGDIFISDDYSDAIYLVSRRDLHQRQPVIASTDVKEAGLTLDSRQVAFGAELFGNHACTQCHTPALNPLQDLATQYTQDSLASFFTAPTPPMPRFELTAEEREALAAYLLSWAH